MADAIEQKRRETDKRMTIIELQLLTAAEALAAGDERMKRLEHDLLQNTQATSRIEENTNEIVSFFKAAKGGFEVLEFFAKCAKIAAAIIVSCGAIWAAYEGWGKK